MNVPLNMIPDLCHGSNYCTTLTTCLVFRIMYFLRRLFASRHAGPVSPGSPACIPSLDGGRQGGGRSVRPVKGPTRSVQRGCADGSRNHVVPCSMGLAIIERSLRLGDVTTVTYAGKTYNTFQIGTQCWLRENLDVGGMVLGTEEQTDNDTIEKYCYDNNPANCATYGFYQWDEAMQYDTTQGVQGICPPGWHLPTLVEFQTLSATVGGDGNALKAIGQGSGGGAGTNTSGFSVLLAGIRMYDGLFGSLGSIAYLWSSTQTGATTVRSLDLNDYDGNVGLGYGYKYNGFSVRCLKD